MTTYTTNVRVPRYPTYDQDTVCTVEYTTHKGTKIVSIAKDGKPVTDAYIERRVARFLNISA